jgi:ArsR family transcriptional regulator
VIRRIATLLGVAVLLGAAANAVSPRGLTWDRPADELPTVGREQLLSQLRDPKLLLLDARPVEEYRIGRLPRAVSMPWRTIEERGGTPPPPGRIVIYCSNEFCADALGLGRWLRKHGHRDVSIYVAGYEDWWNARGPTEKD